MKKLNKNLIGATVGLGALAATIAVPISETIKQKNKKIKTTNEQLAKLVELIKNEYKIADAQYKTLETAGLPPRVQRQITAFTRIMQGTRNPGIKTALQRAISSLKAHYWITHKVELTKGASNEITKILNALKRSK